MSYVMKNNIKTNIKITMKNPILIIVELVVGKEGSRNEY